MLRRTVLLGLAALVFGVASLIFADWWVTIPEDRQPEYVGRKTCRGCHDKFIGMWNDTSHDLAMDHATPKTVLGEFGSEDNPTSLTHFDTPFRMFRKGDEFFVQTPNAAGESEQFPVKYVFGALTLQQYLVELPGGRLQALPVAWDVKNGKWYHLYPDEPITADDPLHWTRRLQNWNYMCAECHVTNYQKGYDAKNDCYHTKFGEIDVSCEACHGPCSLHVELATSNIFWDRKIGKGIPNPRDPKIEIDSCAPCHSRRQHIYPGFKPGEEFLDYYLPEMLDSEHYYADGQILDEDYSYGSYVQSRMFHNKVRCWTCHSSTVKHKDNRLCGQCHDPKKYDTAEHHFHEPHTPGAECINCHMPQKTYMGVDRRHDHSFRIPRPDLTAELEIPNACNTCHKDNTPEWAEQQLTKWYGERKKTVPHFAHAIAAGRKIAPDGDKKLIEAITHKAWPGYVRASALMLLENYRSSDATETACKNLKDPDPLVRYAAVHALEHASPPIRNRNVGPMLSDPVRAVRLEAARVLSPIKERSLAQKYSKAFDSAIAEYRKGQDYLADQPAAHLNLAVIHENLHYPEKALAEYEHALKLDPTFVPARMNIAMLLDKLGDKERAETELRKAVETEPDFGEAYYSLGLLIAENEQRLPEATTMLAKAAELSPANSRMHYNLGLAYQKQGKTSEAEAALKESCRLAPDQGNLWALAILYAQTDRRADAVKTLQQLLRISPGNPQATQLLKQLQ